MGVSRRAVRSVSALAGDDSHLAVPLSGQRDPRADHGMVALERSP